ncbi:MAG: DUF4215 domain-containing protein [Nannocystaceae bacterium]
MTLVSKPLELRSTSSLMLLGSLLCASCFDPAGGGLDADTSAGPTTMTSPEPETGDSTDGPDSTGTPSQCGDGVLDEGEECDDGEGNADTAACKSDCTAQFCGDGFVHEGVEACDDGNTNDDDGCLSTCVSSTCGDGVVQDGLEQCDDGNDDDTDSCPSNCLDATCGDGFMQAGVEECDDANTNDNDACPGTCLPAVCGDGFVYAGGGEDCDDEGESATCDADCTLALCGDGTTNIAAGEQCDDANLSDGDACPSTCLDAVCGDGFVNAGVEECDGANVGTADCTDVGFTGNLSCDGGCALDYSTCGGFPCPDGGLFINNYCWYAPVTCQTAEITCAEHGLVGTTGFVPTVWNLAVMNALAAGFGLSAGGDAGCCVEFAWVESGSIFTHNFGPQFYNWSNCYNSFPTIKACEPF